MNSAWYPDSAVRPATKIIQARNIDSRSRDDYFTTQSTPSSYTVTLRDSLQRVSAMQLSDIHLPDSRYTVDQGREDLTFSTPLELTQISTLSVTETWVEYNTVSQAVVRTVSTNAKTMLVPKTLNTCSGTVSTTNVLLFAEPHGLYAVANYWPKSANIAQIRATRFQNEDPAIVWHPTTVTQTPVQNATRITITQAYVDTWTPAHGAEGDSLNNAYLHVPRLTIPEYANVVQGWLSDSEVAVTAWNNRYRFEWNSVTSEIEFRLSSKYDGYRGTLAESVTSTFAVVQYDVMWMLGFDPGTYTLSTMPTKTVPRPLRTLRLPRGAYPVSSLTDYLSYYNNTLYFHETLTAEERQIPFTNEGGVGTNIQVPTGWFTPSQFAVWFNDQLNTNSISSAYTVTYNATVSAFTVANLGNDPFTLDFRGASQTQVARALGFEEMLYAGTTSYSSTLPVAFGMSNAETIAGTVIRGAHSRPIVWDFDTITRRIDAHTELPTERFYVTNFAVVAGNTVTWRAWTTSAANVVYAHHLQHHDVVRMTNNDGSLTFSAIVVNAPTNAGVNTLTLDMGAAGTLSTLSVMLNTLTNSAVLIERPTFVLHSNVFPDNYTFPTEDLTGRFLRDDAGRISGTGAAYGSVYGMLGAYPLASNVSTGIYVAPHNYDMDPPPYVTMEVVASSANESSKHVHAYQDTVRSRILAKLILTKDFARIGELMEHTSFTSPAYIERLNVAFRDPDGRITNFNGRDHSFTLLFREWSGHVHGVGVE